MDHGVIKNDVLFLSDIGAVALMLSISCGVLALVVEAAWTVEHNCGNRYCRHVERGDDDVDWRRP